MPPKLFNALVVAGASLTGSIGIAVVPAVATLPGCSSDAPLAGGLVGSVDAGHIVIDGFLGAGDAHVTGIDMGPMDDGGDGGQ